MQIFFVSHVPSNLCSWKGGLQKTYRCLLERNALARLTESHAMLSDLLDGTMVL